MAKPFTSISSRSSRSRSVSSILPPDIQLPPPVKTSFSDVANQSVLDKLSMEERHRQELIYELLNSERQYVYELNLFAELIQKPVIKANLLTKQETSATFTNFSEILAVSTNILNECEKRRQEDVVLQKIGDIFLKQEQNFKLYTAYSTNYPLVKSSLEQLKERNPTFSDFLQKLSSRPELRGISILDCLYLPIQHFNLYAEIIQNISQYTPADHQDYQDLNDALEMIHSFVDFVNRAVAHSFNVQKLIEIQKRIDPNEELRLNLPTRKFIRAGFANVIFKSKNKKVIESEIILCNNLVLLVKKGGHKVYKKINTRLTLQEVVDENGKELYAFELVNEGESIIVSFTTKDEKDSWINSLAQNYQDFDREEGKQQKALFILDSKKKKNKNMFRRKDTPEKGNSVAKTEERPFGSLLLMNLPPNTHPRVAAQIRWLSNKLQSTRTTGDELKAQISRAVETKKKLERELTQLQSSESELQYARLLNELQLTHTLMTAEMMFNRWFHQQLDRIQRETLIVEKDLERVKKQIEQKGVEEKKSKEEEKHLVTMVAYEEEKNKFLESEKNRLGEICKESLQKLENEYEICSQDKQRVSEALAKSKLDLRAEIEKKKKLSKDQQILRARLDEARLAISHQPLEILLQIREQLIKRKEASQEEITHVPKSPRDEEVENESNEDRSTTQEANFAPPSASNEGDSVQEKEVNNQSDEKTHKDGEEKRIEALYTDEEKLDLELKDDTKEDGREDIKDEEGSKRKSSRQQQLQQLQKAKLEAEKEKNRNRSTSAGTSSLNALARKKKDDVKLVSNYGLRLKKEKKPEELTNKEDFPN